MQCRFAKFELDTIELRIAADGRSLDADARQLQLLSLLIEAYPACCERTALLQQLWPNTVVSEWSLGRLVSDTRKFFRQQGYSGPLIQTLHGRGYRLAPELAEQLVFPAPEREQPQPPPAGSLRRRIWRVGAALALLLAGGAAYHFLAPHTPLPAPLVIGEAPDTRGRILWVDDNPQNNLAERRFLEGQGIAVYGATNSEDALALLSMYRYDAVISDMGRGREGLAGLKLLEQMRARGIHTPFFLYTILTSKAQQSLLRERGGQGVAVTPDALYGLVLPVIEKRAQQQ
ncbi:winged helix-turn-helix domain-containing protein [Microbulbifer sp. SAOS-129_SWC]|uniref:winged helix-turn-helix domain-containing protein n=1 Tax=Microbulbifer sp. SAOS-129_SWC TaxID=3145235 RepID=UPI0032176B99